MNLKELEELEKKASPWPWWSDGSAITTDSKRKTVENAQGTIAECLCGLSDADMSELDANLELIVAARNMLPKFLRLARAIWAFGFEPLPMDGSTYNFDSLVKIRDELVAAYKELDETFAEKDETMERIDSMRDEWKP